MSRVSDQGSKNIKNALIIEKIKKTKRFNSTSWNQRRSRDIEEVIIYSLTN